MIRYAFINNQVLKIYSKLPSLTFPISVNTIVKNIPNCRYMSYQRFSKINNCSIEDVIQICESTSGCTHYDILQNRYLILCNRSTENNNNIGRQRWTCCHEIGHIVCKHHEISAYNKLSENNLLQVVNPKYEIEADYFAATLLAPFPIFKFLNINSVSDVQNTFGLSYEASIYRYEQYSKWRYKRIKSSWESDMVNLYKQRNSIF